MKVENAKEKEKEESSSCLIVKHDDKTFLNLGCCDINIGLIFTYLYIISASGLNIINRIIFNDYKFTFNFTYGFIQQLVSLFLFLVIGTRSDTFKKAVGDLGFSEFSKFECYYISFAIVFIINTLIGFYGMQLVNNVAMFLSLRKLTTCMLFFIDLFDDKRKLSWITIICIFLMSGGSILVGFDTFTKDYTGYIVVIINNVITITYSKFTEVFKRHTGVSNLKLLVYNTYLSIPILIIGALFFGEHIKVYKYITLEKNDMEGTFYGFTFYLFISCIFCAILSSSFFISNEKTSSLMTNLVVNTKTVFITIILFLIDQKKNKITPMIITGLVMTTLGAIFINVESLYTNLKFNSKEESKENNKKPEETELIDINDDNSKDSKV